jgi:tetratricopeptide (TPR) repeat protein
VVLCQLLTGRHPFGPIDSQQSAREVAQAILHRQQSGWKLPLAGHAHLDPSVRHLLARCLDPDPERRPATAAVLRDELRRCLRVDRRTLRWAQRPTAVREQRLGQQSMHSQEYVVAQEHFSRAIAADESDHRLWFARGRARQEQGDYRAAFDDYAQAQQLASDGRYLAAMAYCMAQVGDLGRAIRHFELALSAGFETPALHVSLGRCYALQHDHSRARTCFDRAISVQPACLTAYHYRALNELHSSQRRQAPLDPQAVIDIETAASAEAAPANVLVDAAYICYVHSQQDSSDSSLDSVLLYLTAAVEAGADPKTLEAWRKLPGLRGNERLVALLNRSVTPPEPPARYSQFLDPLGESVNF